MMAKTVVTSSRHHTVSESEYPAKTIKEYAVKNTTGKGRKSTYRGTYLICILCIQHT